MRVSWKQLYQDIEECKSCALFQSCTHKVPGQGDIHSPLMLIGEGPGYHEDQQGLAFVGPAGQLLTKMLLAIQLPRERVYICNTVKCRPPQNRTPSAEETGACISFLRQQTALIRPKVILLLGATAMNTVLGTEFRITRDHGKWFERKGVLIMATYHPSALLRNPEKKREAWEDLKLLREKLTELGLYSDLLCRQQDDN